MSKINKRKIKSLVVALGVVLNLLAYCYYEFSTSNSIPDTHYQMDESAHYQILDQEPDFDLTTSSYESYSKLDFLGRVGVAEACLGPETLPTESRGSISHVYPSGWDNNYYEFVESNYVYNRCHMIGFQLSGENDNELNLMTGTRSFNVDGMLPFENIAADYIDETGNHVMYRVTPHFEGSNLVAHGITLEMQSVETDDISYVVYIPNIEEGVSINYKTGENTAT